MANPHPKTDHLNKGNTVGVGRKPSVVTKRRLEYLEDIENARSCKPGGSNVYADALEGLAGLLAEGDGPTVRWYFDQLMGSPKTSVEYVVGDTEVFMAVARVIVNYLDEETKNAFFDDLKAEIAKA